MKYEDKEKKLYVTEQDMARLEFILDAAFHKNNHQEENIKKLMDDMDGAVIVNERDVPTDVVIMNSEVSVMDIDSNEKMTFELVFPEDANLDKKKVSVLAPVGSAVLGYRAGDVVEWNVPSRRRRLKINKVVQKSG